MLAFIAKQMPDSNAVAFNEDAVSLRLRPSTADIKGLQHVHCGTLHGRDVIVGLYIPGYNSRVEPFRYIWVAMRVNILDKIPIGAYIHTTGPKRPLRAFGEVRKELDPVGKQALDSAFTEPTLALANGLLELAIYANALPPTEAMATIARDAWGPSWTGAVMTTHIAPDANADAIRATAAQLARVAEALEANR